LIDELLCQWDNHRAIISLRASAPMWRKPFIEISYLDGEIVDMHFAKDLFVHYWSEAVVVLETLTDIELISEFKYHLPDNHEETNQVALSTRAACIRECDAMFEEGFYQVYSCQFGCNCKSLPAETLEKLKIALSRA
ncbi:MAG: hypothetical protein GY770_32465, partial [Aestuariibacter sp.]|nr:hypothetical protein [Aestuariibacter sp.]